MANALQVGEDKVAGDALSVSLLAAAIAGTIFLIALQVSASGMVTSRALFAHPEHVNILPRSLAVCYLCKPIGPTFCKAQVLLHVSLQQAERFCHCRRMDLDS